VFPIIGGRKVEQLQENIGALDIALSAEQIKRIEDAAPFNPGFPHNMIVRHLATPVRGGFVDVLL